MKLSRKVGLEVERELRRVAGECRGCRTRVFHQCEYRLRDVLARTARTRDFAERKVGSDEELRDGFRRDFLVFNFERSRDIRERAPSPDGGGGPRGPARAKLGG